jgi:hypothetical protein
MQSHQQVSICSAPCIYQYTEQHPHYPASRELVETKTVRVSLLGGNFFGQALPQCEDQKHTRDDGQTLSSNTNNKTSSKVSYSDMEPTEVRCLKLGEQQKYMSRRPPADSWLLLVQCSEGFQTRYILSTVDIEVII